ncbi:MAG: molybdopterin-binding oxidoreductase, partial [Acidimicrobiia bacterium]
MRPTRARNALAGVLAAGLALGVSELIAGFFSSAPSLIEGLGNWVIDHVPSQVKEWAISLFGTNDKLVLLLSITAVTILIGGFVGLFARRRFWLAVVVYVGFGLIAALAAVSDPQVTFLGAVVPAGLAALVGLATLRMLYSVAEPGEEAASDFSRRRFLLGASAVVGVAALSAGFGRALMERAKRAVSGREDVVLPSA